MIGLPPKICGSLVMRARSWASFMGGMCQRPEGNATGQLWSGRSRFGALLDCSLALTWPEAGFAGAGFRQVDQDAAAMARGQAFTATNNIMEG
jgi:hypothetical protein